MAERINTKDLANALAENTKGDRDNVPEMNKTQAKEVIDLLVSLIEETVVEGNQVSLTGFGKFERYERQNGAFKPKFTPYTAFKDAVSA